MQRSHAELSSLPDAPATPGELVGTLPPQTEGMEELLVGALHDLLADRGHPSSESLGPGLSRVSFGRMDDSSPIVVEPLELVFGAFEALVSAM
jgi:hypothetical protein